MSGTRSGVMGAVAACALVGSACLIPLGSDRIYREGQGGSGGGSGGDVSVGGAGGAGAGGEAPHPHACTPGSDVRWVKRLGGPGPDRVFATAPDGSGGIYLAGYFVEPVDLGGGPLLDIGYDDIWVARFDADGHHLWSRSFGTPSDDSVNGERLQMAALPSGAVVLGAVAQTSIDFGAGPPFVEGIDSFVVRLSADGEHEWTRWLTGTGLQQLRGLAFDSASGTILVAGGFQETSDLAGVEATSVGGTDIFVLSLDRSDGSVADHWTFGGPLEDIAYVAVGTGGSSPGIAVGGFVRSDLDFGQGVTAVVDNKDPFLAVLDASLELSWGRVFASAGLAQVRKIVVEPSGTILFGGRLHQDPGTPLATLDVGTGPVTPRTDGMFLARVAPNTGAGMAATSWGGLTIPHHMVRHDDGTVLVSGTAYSAIDLDDRDVVVVAGVTDGVLARVGDALETQAKHLIASAGNDAVLGVAPSDGDVLVAGNFNAVVEIAGCPPLIADGPNGDVFLMKRAP